MILRLCSSFFRVPGLLRFFNAPWIPIYLFAVFLVHFELGVFVSCSALVILALAFLNETWTCKAQAQATGAASQAEKTSESLRQSAEAVRALIESALGRRALLLH